MDAPRWIYVARRFNGLAANLALTNAQVEDGGTKARGVVSCLNSAYRGNASSSDNAFLIGSWGKETAVRPPGDVDLYYVLPTSVYERFERYSVLANKQSALLQEVRGHLAATFSRSEIKGDGPVVIAAFASLSIEVVPAFVWNSTNGSYIVPATRGGGQYLLTRPRAEIHHVAQADGNTAGNTRALIRMLKCWRSYCNVPIKSFILELLAVEFLDQWAYRTNSVFWHDWMVRDYFDWMIGKVNGYVTNPGTGDILPLGADWLSRANSAGGRAKKACTYEESNQNTDAGEQWQLIFGNFVPRTA